MAWASLALTVAFFVVPRIYTIKSNFEILTVMIRCHGASVCPIAPQDVALSSCGLMNARAGARPEHVSGPVTSRPDSQLKYMLSAD